MLLLISLQTSLSNASQVVISQVDTNISGKFSCEGKLSVAWMVEFRYLIITTSTVMKLSLMMRGKFPCDVFFLYFALGNLTNIITTSLWSFRNCGKINFMMIIKISTVSVISSSRYKKSQKTIQ